MIKYYNLADRWLKHRSPMRMHVFPDTRLPTPRMVLTNKLVELGFGSPVYPFLREIVDYYQIAPIQLSPNSYRMIIGLYMTEISHFVGLRRSGNDLGFYEVTLYPSHNKKGFSVGNPSNMKFGNPVIFIYLMSQRYGLSLTLTLVSHLNTSPFVFLIFLSLTVLIVAPHFFKQALTS